MVFSFVNLIMPKTDVACQEKPEKIEIQIQIKHKDKVRDLDKTKTQIIFLIYLEQWELDLKVEL